MTSMASNNPVRNRARGGRGNVEGGHFNSYGEELENKKLTLIHNEIRILTGSSNPALALEVANLLQVDLQQPITYFDNNPLGEMDINIPNSLRQKRTFFMQAASPSGLGVSNGILEMIMMIDAARKASSGERTAFFAPMAYQRKDRPDDQQKIDATRQASGAKVILNMLEEAGADRFMTVELHALQELFFTDKPYDALFGSRVLVPAVRSEIQNAANTFYLSPDYGGGERARKWDEFMGGCGSGYMQKRRGPDGVKGFRLLGQVRKHHVVIVDDVCATGSTLIEASKLAHRNGALTVSVVVVHGEFNNKPGEKLTCLQKLKNAGIDRVFTTDTIAQRDEVRNDPMVRVVKVAPLIAEAFRTVAQGKSIHDISH